MVKSIGVAFVGFSVVCAVAAARPVPTGATEVRQSAEADRNYIVDAAFLRGAYQPGTIGLTSPRVIKMVRPQYTPAAMSQKLAGEVHLKLRIAADGSVDAVRVVKSLDRKQGLDAEAIKAARAGRYAPATRAGRPVASIVDVQMTFTLR